MFFYRILSLFPSPPFLLFNSALNFLHTSLNDESNLQLVTLINVLQQTQKKEKKKSHITPRASPVHLPSGLCCQAISRHF